MKNQTNLTPEQIETILSEISRQATETIRTAVMSENVEFEILPQAGKAVVFGTDFAAVDEAAQVLAQIPALKFERRTEYEADDVNGAELFIYYSLR